MRALFETRTGLPAPVNQPQEASYLGMSVDPCASDTNVINLSILKLKVFIFNKYREKGRNQYWTSM